MLRRVRIMLICCRTATYVNHTLIVVRKDGPETLSALPAPRVLGLQGKRMAQISERFIPFLPRACPRSRPAACSSARGPPPPHASCCVTVRCSSASVNELLPAAPAAGEADVPFIELPAHAPRDSLLHSGSGFDNYRGLYNLAILALVRVIV